MLVRVKEMAFNGEMEKTTYLHIDQITLLREDYGVFGKEKVWIVGFSHGGSRYLTEESFMALLEFMGCVDPVQISRDRKAVEEKLSRRTSAENEPAKTSAENDLLEPAKKTRKRKIQARPIDSASGDNHDV